MHPLVLLGVFAAATLLGYKVIKTVPSLLHTPLMSGMNALSGLTVLGALTTVAKLTSRYNSFVGAAVGGLAVVLAMINVAGGFGVTHRMLKMFDKGDRE